jgi:hypothetical protein
MAIAVLHPGVFRLAAPKFCVEVGQTFLSVSGNIPAC